MAPCRSRRHGQSNNCHLPRINHQPDEQSCVQADDERIELGHGAEEEKEKGRGQVTEDAPVLCAQDAEDGDDAQQRRGVQEQK